MTLGDTLHQLCQAAEQELWLVAPFIKVATLQRLLEGVAPDVQLMCVTRWRPEEIAAGVSDIEVWPILKARPHSQLWLRPDLHAKYYRADTQCLMGSANITATALGWTSQPNLELLIDVSPQHPALVGFEDELMTAAILVDDNLYEQTQAVVDLLTKEKPASLPILGESRLSIETAINRETWLPTLRNPEQLYVAYVGNQDRLSMGVYESAVTDLQALNLPDGLSKASFEAYVGYVLLQMPLISKVDAFVKEPRRFGEVSTYLKGLPYSPSQDFDAKSAWQTLMRWLLHFLPQHFGVKVPNYTEIFYKKL